MDDKVRGSWMARRPDLWGDAMHDLRQPLQSLLLLTRVVAGSDDAEARDKGARYMEAALLNLQAMLEMLGRLSRLQSGALVPVPERCDLAARLAGLEPALAALAGLAGRRLRVAGGGCGSLTCDASLLAAMVRGLVGHAARYGSGDIDLGCDDGPGGGRIVVGFDRDSNAAPRRDVFIDLGAGRISEAVAEPVPGLALVERMAAVAGLRLGSDAEAGGRVLLTLAAV